MSQRIKSVWFLWTLLLLCIDLNNFVGVGIAECSWLDRNRTATIDRTIVDSTSTGYYVLPVDRTALSVNYPVWLQQIDISKIFINNGSSVDNVPVKVKIVEKYLSDMRDKDVLFVGYVTLNSENETIIKFSPEIALKPKFMYEIRLAVPEIYYAYDGNLNNKEYRIKRFAWRSVIMTFYQNNAAENPPNSKQEWSVSHGMVKRLHLKYPNV